MKILVPVEDILFGSAIANFIVQHQWPDDTEFRIIHVVEPFFLGEHSHAPFAKLMELSGEQILGAAKRTVEEVAQLIQEALPHLKVARHVIEGHIKEQIISISEDWPADLIIAGSHGRSGFNRFMLGSVSLMLVSEAPCPVLLIKPDASTLKLWDGINTFASTSKVATACQKQESRRVLIALDDTEISEQIIDFVIDHKWTQPAHFKLLSVIRQPMWLERKRPELAEMYQDAINVRQAALRTLALKMRDHYHSPHIEEETTEGDPKKSIVEGAEAWNADLIILGCHYRPALQKFALGSVSLAVLCTAHCPVLVLRQKAKAAKAALAGKESEAKQYGKASSARL